MDELGDEIRSWQRDLRRHAEELRTARSAGATPTLNYRRPRRGTMDRSDLRLCAGARSRCHRPRRTA
jgi:hypothetical protein